VSEQDGRTRSLRRGRSAPVGGTSPGLTEPWDQVLFECTYELRHDGPPAMQWNAYRTTGMTEWAKLLAENPAEDEVQRFLEQHPSLVPGTLGLGAADNHGPFFDSLVSQSVLCPGLGCRPRQAFYAEQLGFKIDYDGTFTDEYRVDQGLRVNGG
jgi:hypothetical protein